MTELSVMLISGKLSEGGSVRIGADISTYTVPKTCPHLRELTLLSSSKQIEHRVVPASVFWSDEELKDARGLEVSLL